MDAIQVAGFITGIGGIVSLVTAYLVQRRSVAVVELEASLKHLREDNDELRMQLREVRRELSETKTALHLAEERLYELERKEAHPNDRP